MVSSDIKWNKGEERGGQKAHELTSVRGFEDDSVFDSGT